MNILVIGGGAREHTICEAIKQSKKAQLFSVMHNQNPGIARLTEDFLIEDETNVERVVDYAKKKNIDLVIVGPEAPLQAGVTNALIEKDITVCSPTREAARIETDKEWMRALMQKHNIPGRLKHETFTKAGNAKKFISRLNGEVAVKPVGLTGGKGVRVYGDHFDTITEAAKYAKTVIDKKIGGEAKVLIEELAVGEEFTVQAFSDGSTILPLPAVQDHKRLLPGDEGPNTGGMGSYSCADGLLPFLTKGDYEASTVILQRIVEALKAEGCEYKGVIYGQFMLTADGPKVIEINARFGDPENMNILPLLESDFVELCQAVINGNIDSKRLQMKKKATVCKYVVPEGYGVDSMADQKIMVDEPAIRNQGAKLYYASVNQKNSDIYTTTSRSLAIVGIAENLENAEKACEQGLNHIDGDHIFIRHDIGKKDLVQQRITHMKRIRG